VEVGPGTVAGLVADPAFWRGRRVLLTGHTGFKGSWLALWLGHMGAEVSGYALAPATRPSLFEVAGIADGMASEFGDVRDLEHLAGFVSARAPEVVFHLAAQPLVRRGYREPVETYATNVMGTVHLLEAVRRSPGVRVVINVTSDKCYENREWPWGYRESDALGGRDPYSNSKGCSELVTAAYRASYFANAAEGGVAVASARAGNVIGGGDWSEDRLVPDIVRSVQAGRPVWIRRPDAIRPWQHVADPLNGYLLLAERLWADPAGFAEGWNFGPAPDDAWPVARVTEAVLARWEGAPPWQLEPGDHPHEAATLILDAAKARARLGWHPRWDLGTAIAETVDWYRAHESGADMRKTTLAQLARFAAGPETPPHG
jgi:CDP-glucose 4,6-dehydratase